MDEPSGKGRAALVRDGVEFAARDVALLRAIDETGSVATASRDLGRSRARDLARIEELEGGFGGLVERRRGGSGGGGSRLTANARALLDRYDRLQAALTATATVPETVLDGRVTSVNGELADVDTHVGSVRGLHAEVAPGDPVQARVGADAITILDRDADLEPEATSARNYVRGHVVTIDRGETIRTVAVAVDGQPFQVLVTADSETMLALHPDRAVLLTWKATATRLIRDRGPA